MHFLYAGNSEFQPNEKGIQQEIEKWKSGDTIPALLVHDASRGNPMAGHSPVDYICKISNSDLLVAVAVHSKTPEYNRAAAIKRLLELNGLHGYFLEVQKYLSAVHFKDESDSLLEELHSQISKKCVAAYTLFVNAKKGGDKDMNGVLDKVKSLANSGKTASQIIELMGSSVGNGGMVYLSEATNCFLPSYFFPGKNPKPFLKLLTLKEDEFAIIEEKISQSDEKLKKTYGPGIYTQTENRVFFCKITEVLNN
jgi:hypothetical protein